MGSIFDRYISSAPEIESGQPPDTIPADRYPAKIVGARVALIEGVSDKTGEPYRFGDVRVQLQVVDGPAKGATTWLRLPITPPEPGRLEEGQEKRLRYFTARLYHNTGLGRRLDPQWRKEQAANPLKPGKTTVVYHGRMLSRDALAAIAANDQEAKELTALLVGLTGIWTLGTSVATTRSGETFEEQTYKGVEELNDANMAAWRDRATGSSGTSSAYE